MLYDKINTLIQQCIKLFCTHETGCYLILFLFDEMKRS